MKERQGFVSNSSTSSFCIYGAALSIDLSKPLKYIYKIKRACPKEFDEYVEGLAKSNYRKERYELLKNLDTLTSEQKEQLNEDLEEEFSYDLGDMLQMYSRYDYDCGYLFVGDCWTSIGDDETGRQFKERIEKTLKAIFGDDVKVGTQEGEYAS